MLPSGGAMRLSPAGAVGWPPMTGASATTAAAGRPPPSASAAAGTFSRGVADHAALAAAVDEEVASALRQPRALPPPFAAATAGPVEAVGHTRDEYERDGVRVQPPKVAAFAVSAPRGGATDLLSPTSAAIENARRALARHGEADLRAKAAALVPAAAEAVFAGIKTGSLFHSLTNGHAPPTIAAAPSRPAAHPPPHALPPFHAPPPTADGYAAAATAAPPPRAGARTPPLPPPLPAPAVPLAAHPRPPAAAPATGSSAFRQPARPVPVAPPPGFTTPLAQVHEASYAIRDRGLGAGPPATTLLPPPSVESQPRLPHWQRPTSSSAHRVSLTVRPVAGAAGETPASPTRRNIAAAGTHLHAVLSPAGASVSEAAGEHVSVGLSAVADSASAAGSGPFEVTATQRPRGRQGTAPVTSLRPPHSSTAASISTGGGGGSASSVITATKFAHVQPRYLAASRQYSERGQQQLAQMQAAHRQQAALQRRAPTGRSASVEPQAAAAGRRRLAGDGDASHATATTATAAAAPDITRAPAASTHGRSASVPRTVGARAAAAPAHHHGASVAGPARRSDEGAPPPPPDRSAAVEALLRRVVMAVVAPKLAAPSTAAAASHVPDGAADGAAPDPASDGAVAAPSAAALRSAAPPSQAPGLRSATDAVGTAAAGAAEAEAAQLRAALKAGESELTEMARRLQDVESGMTTLQTRKAQVTQLIRVLHSQLKAQEEEQARSAAATAAAALAGDRATTAVAQGAEALLDSLTALLTPPGGGARAGRLERLRPASATTSPSSSHPTSPHYSHVTTTVETLLGMLSDPAVASAAGGASANVPIATSMTKVAELAAGVAGRSAAAPAAAPAAALPAVAETSRRSAIGGGRGERADGAVTVHSRVSASGPSIGTSSGTSSSRSQQRPHGASTAAGSGGPLPTVPAAAELTLPDGQRMTMHDAIALTAADLNLSSDKMRDLVAYRMQLLESSLQHAVTEARSVLSPVPPASPARQPFSLTMAGIPVAAASVSASAPFYSSPASPGEPAAPTYSSRSDDGSTPIANMLAALPAAPAATIVPAPAIGAAVQDGSQNVVLLPPPREAPPPPSVPGVSEAAEPPPTVTATATEPAAAAAAVERDPPEPAIAATSTANSTAASGATPAASKARAPLAGTPPAMAAIPEGEEEEEDGGGAAAPAGLVDRDSTTAAPATGPRCVQCEASHATRHCHECGDDYCDGCFASVHAKGRRRDHLWTPFSPLSQGYGSRRSAFGPDGSLAPTVVTLHDGGGDGSSKDVASVGAASAMAHLSAPSMRRKDLPGAASGGGDAAVATAAPLPPPSRWYVPPLDEPVPPAPSRGQLLSEALKHTGPVLRPHVPTRAVPPPPAIATAQSQPSRFDGVKRPGATGTHPGSTNVASLLSEARAAVTSALHGAAATSAATAIAPASTEMRPRLTTSIAVYRKVHGNVAGVQVSAPSAAAAAVAAAAAAPAPSPASVAPAAASVAARAPVGAAAKGATPSPPSHRSVSAGRAPARPVVGAFVVADADGTVRLARDVFSSEGRSASVPRERPAPGGEAPGGGLLPDRRALFDAASGGGIGGSDGSGVLTSERLRARQAAASSRFVRRLHAAQDAPAPSIAPTWHLRLL